MSDEVQLRDGNLLVVAGAGAGKTYRLVQTCLARIHAGVGIDEILIVTFTKAAAAELRKRIGAALQAAFEAQPDSAHLARQIAVLDRAQISTLHSFCLDLVSRHFAELGLSPRLLTLEAAQSAALQAETLETIFTRYYEGKTEADRAAKNFLLDWFKGDEGQVRHIIARLHQFTQTRPNAASWFAEQRALFSQEDPTEWRRWHAKAVEAFGEEWRPVIEAQAPGPKNPAREKILALLDSNGLAEIAALYENEDVWPRGSKKDFRNPVKEMFDEAGVLASWATTAESDPLLEDWNYARAASLELLRIAEEFAIEFAAEKARRGLVDFHDLEQFALRLLWDDAADAPNERAREWQRRFKWIFVDEYQDINQAQDRIIRAIGSEPGNRFLVGDVKQSIYGFRQADPEIFKRYHESWSRKNGGECEYLNRNWRSHERLLDFINAFFAVVMHESSGGVEYDENARLQFAAVPERAHLSAAVDGTPKVEVHMVDRSEDEEGVFGGEESPLAEMGAAEAEAEIIARWCREAVEGGAVVLPDGKRPTYGDIAILHRSAANAVEPFAKVFSRRGIPFEARRTGFFECIEILDLTSLLTILDNPLQDIPLLGVLRSPFGCFSVDDLAAVRAADASRPFFLALRESESEKAKTFLEKFGAWRKLSRDTSLAERLETILEESGYEDWAAAQNRGGQRRANIRRLVELARQFDRLSGEGLYPFLQFVEDQMKEAGAMAAATPAAGAVRLMTVHQSKGLQFPIVIVAGLGGRFNARDFSGTFLLDDDYGLCVKARPPKTRRQYETIAFRLAKQRQEQRLAHEEMRILYVALTRAESRLVLVGAPSKKMRERWAQGEPRPTAARSMLDWLGPWLASQSGDFLEAEQGVAKDWVWRWHTAVAPQSDFVRPAITTGVVDPAALAALKERMDWKYPQAGATAQEAKSSATALRRAQADEPELARVMARGRPAKGRGKEAGQAAHVFMQHARIETLRDEAAIIEEIERLVGAGVLTKKDVLAIAPEKIASFWRTPFGSELLARVDSLRRELRFTARFTRADLAAIGAPGVQEFGDEEFIVVQGAADLVAVLEEELWLVDFKTDRAPRVEEYALQLRIYALALSRVYKKPVTRACLRFIELEQTEWIAL